MQRQPHLFYAILLTLLLSACSGKIGSNNQIGSVPEPTPPPAAGTFGDGRLGDLIEWSRSTHGLPAMGVVIIQNGQISEMAAQGLRATSASDRVTADDRWHLGSLTKAVTSTLAGVLVDQSVISWDTRPLDVWPELDASIHPLLRGVTLLQLLSHTAGIRRVNAAPSQYGDLAPGTLIEKRRAFAAELLGEAPVGPIGQESYSNGGYIIAGAMLEAIMSSSWESLVSDFVFGPLGMTSSGFGAPGIPDDLSQPWGHWDQGISYEPVSPGLEADNPQVFGPAGTVHATLVDYARFMAVHIAGFRGVDGIMTADTFRVVHTPVVNGSALGWGVRENIDEPGVMELVHAGSNLRWFAFVRLVPDLDVGVLYVVNAGGGMAQAAIDALDDVLEERFENSR